jgi:hypothetical protein
MRTLAVLSAIGLVGNLLWHILALLGRVTEFGIPVLVLAAGLFIVLIPAVAVGVKRARGVGRAEAWQAMLGGSAKWAELLMSGTLLYVAALGVVMRKTHYLSWLGPTSRAQVLISGGWLVCYIIAAVLLRPELRAPSIHSTATQKSGPL